MSVEASETKEFRELARRFSEAVHDLAAKYGVDEVVLGFRAGYKPVARVLAVYISEAFEEDVLHEVHTRIIGHSLVVNIWER